MRRSEVHEFDRCWGPDARGAERDYRNGFTPTQFPRNILNIWSGTLRSSSIIDRFREYFTRLLDIAVVRLVDGFACGDLSIRRQILVTLVRKNISEKIGSNSMIGRFRAC